MANGVAKQFWAEVFAEAVAMEPRDVRRKVRKKVKVKEVTRRGR